MKSYIIGLTGQTGAGKTTVSKILQEQGAAIINADNLAHDIYNQNVECKSRIIEGFGEEIVDKHGNIDRKKLGKIVFEDPEMLARLNRISHPYIIDSIKQMIEHYREMEYKYIIIDAAALLESGADRICQAVIYVNANIDRRIRRIVARDNISVLIAVRRAKAQREDSFYSCRSTCVIENDGDVETLKQRTLEAFAFIKEKINEETPGDMDPSDDLGNLIADHTTGW